MVSECPPDPTESHGNETLDGAFQGWSDVEEDRDFDPANLLPDEVVDVDDLPGLSEGERELLKILINLYLRADLQDNASPSGPDQMNDDSSG